MIIKSPTRLFTQADANTRAGVEGGGRIYKSKCFTWLKPQGRLDSLRSKTFYKNQFPSPVCDKGTILSGESQYRQL